MRRRLDIAASIVVTPELMFLDEPTTGLDPRSRNQVWDIIRALVAGGTTILLCTQYLDEADQLAEGIAVIDHGKVIAEGTPPAQGVRRLRRAARAAARPGAAPRGRAAARARSSARSISSPTRPRCRRPAPTRTAAAEALAELHAPGIGSPTSRSASRASTRSSSRSPATRPRSRPTKPTCRRSGSMSTATTTPQTSPAPTQRPSEGARARPRARSARARFRGAHLRLARDAQGQARPGAAARRDDHAGDVRR